MKDLKKILVILLALCLMFSIAACGNEDEIDEADADATVAPYMASITPDQLSNYVIKYSVTEKTFITDEDGNYISTEDGTYQSEEITTNYVEVGYSGILLKSNDGGETFRLDQTATSCFSVVSQDDNRGLLSSFAQFTNNQDQLKDLGKETVAGLETTHYQYKNGMFNYHMYVNDDYNITLKYESEGDMAKKMEVTELVFGAIDSADGTYKIADFQAKLVTPAPTQPAA